MNDKQIVQRMANKAAAMARRGNQTLTVTETPFGIHISPAEKVYGNPLFSIEPDGNVLTAEVSR